MKRTALFHVLALTLIGSPGAFADPTTDGLYAGFNTTQGTFWARLEFQRVPRTVANFVSLAEGSRRWIDFAKAGVVQGRFYDGLTFHRVIDEFMIQGGSRNGKGTDGPGYQFADEFHPDLKHAKAGILSMANSGANSNGGQFFVTVTNTPWLDGKHSVFGEVVEGMEVVFAISKVPTDAGDRPLTPVVVNEVRILRVGAAAQGFDPGQVVPALPEVGPVPAALRHAATKMDLLLKPQTHRILYVFASDDLATWASGSTKLLITNLDVSAFLGAPYQSFSNIYFHSLEAGYEP